MKHTLRLTASRLALCSSLLILFCLCSTEVICQQYATRITVAQDGSGDYTSIQAAIDNAKAFPDERITIFIKSGIYIEKVKVHAWNTLLTLKGENAATTIITWDDYFDGINRGRNSTFYTYTLLVQGDDFQAEDLRVANTAGPVGQAVALAVEADRCVFRNCSVTGYQDALYTAGSNSRQYYDHCYIEGTTDFIFGPATALFDSCTVHSKSNSFITAASTPKGKRYGYVFLNCRLTAKAGVDSVYLGRPWRDFARVVFIHCDMGAHIRPEGWHHWSGTHRDQTAFFAEFGNTGPGADTSKRVPWSHRLNRKAVRRYVPENILKATPSPDPSPAFWTTGGN